MVVATAHVRNPIDVKKYIYIYTRTHTQTKNFRIIYVFFFPFLDLLFLDSILQEDLNLSFTDIPPVNITHTNVQLHITKLVYIGNRMGV